MTAYGQSITPKWFLDRTPMAMTKMGFVRHLHRALLTVGMVPIRRFMPTVPPSGSTNYWLENNNQWMNLEDAQWDELPVVAKRDDFIFWYDYPSAETFQVNGITYRPILMVTCPLDMTDGSNQGSNQTAITISSGYRRADRIMRGDLTPWTRLYVSASNYGGLLTTSALTAGHEGMRVVLWNWKINAASVNATYNQTLAVANFHVILGRGGLVIQVGSGVGKSDSNDVLSCAFLFGGARIPGRARVPEDDSNLNRINPVMPLALTTQSTSYFYQTSFGADDVTLFGARLSSYVMGMQHDLLPSLNGVMAHLFNLENIERPLLPVSSVDTKESPRNVGGTGAHILQRIVYLTWNEINAAAALFGPMRPSIRSQPVPTWEDLWTFPAVRAADRTAPYGEYVDPVTGTNWFMLRASNVQSMLAFEVEGIIKLGAFVTTADTLASSSYLNMNGGAASVLPLGFVMTKAAAFGAFVAATDEITWSVVSTDTVANVLFASPTGTVGDTVSTQYEVTFEAFNRGTSGTVQSTGGAEALFLEYSRDNGASWIAVAWVPCAGTNAANSAYNYATYRGAVAPGDTVDEIRFRIRFSYGNTGFGNHSGGVRNIRVRKITRA